MDRGHFHKTFLLCILWKSAVNMALDPQPLRYFNLEKNEWINDNLPFLKSDAPQPFLIFFIFMDGANKNVLQIKMSQAPICNKNVFFPEQNCIFWTMRPLTIFKISYFKKLLCLPFQRCHLWGYFVPFILQFC